MDYVTALIFYHVWHSPYKFAYSYILEGRWNEILFWILLNKSNDQLLILYVFFLNFILEIVQSYSFAEYFWERLI